MEESKKLKLENLAKKLGLNSYEELCSVYSTLPKINVEAFKLYYEDGVSANQINIKFGRYITWADRTLTSTLNQISLAVQNPVYFKFAKRFVDSKIIDFAIYNIEKIDEFNRNITKYAVEDNLIEKLKKLPSNKFKAFVNYFFKNFSTKETSALLNISQYTSSYTISKKLSEVFAQDEIKNFIKKVKKYYPELKNEEIVYNEDHIEYIKDFLVSNNLDSILKTSKGLDDFYNYFFVEYYLKGKSYYKIGEQRGTTRQSANDSGIMMLKILRRLMNIERTVFTGNSEFKKFMNYSRFIDIKSSFEDYIKNPQFLAIVSAKLGSVEKVIFENLFVQVDDEKLFEAGLGNNDESDEIIKKSFYSISGAVETAKKNYGKLVTSALAEEKIKISKSNEEEKKIIFNKEIIEDLELFLTDIQKQVFHGFICFDEPMDNQNFCEINNINQKQLYALIKNTEYYIRNILARKKDCEEFIENNGGEDFLINEFGATLNEDEFNILISVFMDYHYINLGDIAEALGMDSAQLSYYKNEINNKLNNYKIQKTNIDNLVQKMGGVEKVLEFANNLDEKSRAVFFDIILSYSSIKGTEVAEKINVSPYTVNQIKSRLWLKINEQINENSGDEKQKTEE